MATIGMVLESEYPPDIRVAKEASALAEAGHDVHLLALDFTSQPSPIRLDALTVHRVRFGRELYRKLHPTIVRLPFYRYLWQRWIDDFVRRVRPDVLTVHDLPLAEAGLRVGAARGLPVVLDLHENFPAAIASWGFDRGLVGRHLYSLEHWRAYEMRAVRGAAGVVVVVEEALERLRDYGVPRERTVVVMNTERPEFGAGEDPIDAGGDGPLTLLYIGGFGPHRGIDVAIQAVARLDDVDVRLDVVGDGRIRPQLERLASSSGAAERVRFGSWVSADRVPGEIGRRHVGLVPHARSAHTETTIPHKLFQYMLLGRPVVVSDCAPLARIVRDAGAGVVFRAGDAADMARALRELADPDRRRAMGEAGRRAAADELSWSRDAERLRAFYARVLERSGRPR